jgi:hypothetical protein
MDRIAQIRQLYFKARPATITRDLARAIALLKEMDGEEERGRAAVYMEGLTQMRSEWASGERGGASSPPRDVD